MAFKLTKKQIEANNTVFSNGAENVLLEGGAGSAKTFIILRNIVMRAQKSPGSRHIVARFRFTDCKSAIVFDTYPKVIQLAFPGLKENTNKSDWFSTFENGSEIWFAGLDDKDRLEKILGKEYVTSFINEASQVSYDAQQMVSTRVRQKVQMVVNGREIGLLPTREYFDYNPPSKAHWGYKMFHKGIDPESKQPLKNPNNYVYMKMHPKDNEDNLNPKYIEKLRNKSPRYKKRFYDGEYADDNPNQLFSDVNIDMYRVIDGELPDFVRVVIPVDPSGSADEENATNDEIGIVPVALGTDGNAYVLEDCTVKAGPKTWGSVAVSAFDRHFGDMIVAEKNFGGEMVRYVIQTARTDDRVDSRNIPFKFVTASRGKHVRAEPVAALYEQGRVKHVGYLSKLEDELMGFSTIGYVGMGSPNRADALVWGITELFGGVVKEKKPKKMPVARRRQGSYMG